MRIGTRPVSSSAIIATLGYTPVNKAGDIMTGNLQVNALATSGGGLTLIDTVLARDAANTLAQRNGVTSQAFRLYNTFTDSSNYERLSLRWVGNVGIVSTENAGTGSSRVLRIGNTSIMDFDDATGLISASRSGSSATTIFQVGGTGYTSTGLLFTRLAPSINQASGTYTVLDINPTETAIGAGPHYLIRGRIGAGANAFTVDRAGGVVGVDVTGSNTVSAGAYTFVGVSGTFNIAQGNGSPEGVRSAAAGSIWLRRDGGAGSSFYVKESGTGNTGWVAK
jgi:hypothetical protein